VYYGKFLDGDDGSVFFFSKVLDWVEFSSGLVVRIVENLSRSLRVFVFSPLTRPIFFRFFHFLRNNDPFCAFHEMIVTVLLAMIVMLYFFFPHTNSDDDFSPLFCRL